MFAPRTDFMPLGTGGAARAITGGAAAAAPAPAQTAGDAGSPDGVRRRKAALPAADEANVEPVD